MKSFLAYFGLLFVLMLSGCGSNSKAPDGTPEPSTVSAVSMQKGVYIIQDSSGTKFTLTVPFIKQLDSSYLVELSGFALIVEGCSIKSATYAPPALVLDGAVNSAKVLDISGTFDSSCTPAGYTLGMTQTVTKGSDKDVRQITQKFDYSDPIANTAYSLINETTPIIVRSPDELKAISVDVVDKEGIGISGQNVSITAVSGIKYGSITSASTVASDQSGKAVFTYKAPEDITAVNGQTTKVSLLLENNGTAVKKDISITFDKISTNESMPIVVISNSYKQISLKSNGQIAEMVVQVVEENTNSPFTTGNVKVILPSKVITGSDVGSFESYSVPVGTDGKAVFHYTGPQDLQGLIDVNDKSSTFEFYHEANPTSKDSVLVTYDLDGSYIPSEYILSTSSSDGNLTMGLESQKSFSLYLKDEKDNLVKNEDITNVVIKTKNSLIGKLIDTSNSGAKVDTLTFSGDDAVNSQSFSIQTYKLSGLLPIEITVDFKDANGDPKKISMIMNIVVFSGPPTAMSISYAGVEQNATIAKYIEKFVVTVTDAYNNPVNTRPYIATGGMVEYAVDGSSPTGDMNTTSPRLWHGKNDSHGDLVAAGGDKAQFEAAAGQNIFRYIDFDNDKLVIFGEGYVYEALGKWDIKPHTNDVLDLVDDYFGADRTGLYYAVGHNNRQDLCKTDGTEYVGNMAAGTYQIDTTGHALIDFEYDYHLTGKDIMVWVNLTGYQADNNLTTRIGEAKKHTLRGNGLITPNSYTLSPGDNGIYHFNIHHENAPEWYRNGHFGTSAVGKCQVDNIVDGSNLYDARECQNSAVAYIDLNVSNPGSEDCTITLENIAVSEEFNGVTYP